MATRTFKPAQRMASAARWGLRVREKFSCGGTQVGVDRAHQLAEGRELALGAKLATRKAGVQQQTATKNLPAAKLSAVKMKASRSAL